MKKVMILCVAVAALCSCGRGDKNTDSAPAADTVTTDTAAVDTVPAEQAPVLTEEIVAEAFNAIPDHELDASAEKYMSKALFRDLKEAFSVPTDYPGGIGSEEFLYYFLSGNDDCAPDYGVKGIEITSETTAEVRFKCREVTTYKLTFVEEDGRYVLADFNGAAREVSRYLKNARRIFAGDGARKLLEESGISESDELYDSYLREVAAYKRAYGLK